MDLLEFEHATLKNGIRVYAKRLPWVSGKCQVRILVRTGARWEPEGLEGMAHFFEHLPFMGTEKFPTHKDIWKFDDRYLMGRLNAQTWFDGTTYIGVTENENLPIVMEFFADMLFRPRLDSERLENERKVVLREFYERFPTPQWANLHKFCRKELYGSHPIGRNAQAIGWAETISAIPQEAFQKFHKQYYHTKNIIMLFVGDVDIDQAVKLAGTFSENALEQGEANPLPEKIRYWPAPPATFREFSFEKDLEMKGRQTTEIDYERCLPKIIDSATLAILTKVIRSQIFEEVREKIGGTYSPQVHSQKFLDHYTCKLDVSIAPEVEKETLAIVGKVFDKLRNADAALTESFEDEKGKLLVNMRHQEMGSNELANSAIDIIEANDSLKTITEIINQIKNVSYKDICELMRSELSQDQIYSTIIRP